MEKVIRAFKAHEDAEKADREFYKSLSCQERLDILFDEAWRSRVGGELDGLPVQFISKDLLRRNKATVGRKQDLADLDYL